MSALAGPAVATALRKYVYQIEEIRSLTGNRTSPALRKMPVPIVPPIATAQTTNLFVERHRHSVLGDVPIIIR